MYLSTKSNRCGRFAVFALSVLSAFLFPFLEEMLSVKEMCPFHLSSNLLAQIIHDIVLIILTNNK